MVPVNKNYSLPATLPKLPLQKDSKPRDPEKYSVEKINNVLQHFLDPNHQQFNTTHDAYFLRFIRLMSRDSDWMTSNPDCTCRLMHAVTAMYLNIPFESRAAEKVRKYVTESPSLKQYARCDMKLTVPKESQTLTLQEISVSSLLLACQSSYFDKLLRGGFKEAVNLHKFYNNATQTIPSVQIKEVSPKIVGLHCALLSNASPNEYLPLDEAEELEFIRYVDRTDSFQATSPFVNQCLESMTSRFVDLCQLNKHKWNAKEKKFVASANPIKETLGKLNPFKSEISTEDVLKKMNEFADVARCIKEIKGPYLSKLQWKDLEWLLESINKDATNLNLERCHIEDLSVLDRFQELHTLSLKEVRKILRVESLRWIPKLRNLNLSGCPELLFLEKVCALEQLTFLDLSHCKNILDFYVLFESTSIKKVDLRGSSVENIDKFLLQATHIEFIRD